jgi:hypothetical protein
MGSRSSALLPRLKPPPDPSGRHQNSAIAPRELRISTVKFGSEGVLIAVRDSGPGLAPASLERLFEAFYTTARRSGDGPIDLPFNHRRSRRTVVGDRELAPGRRLSIHSAAEPKYCPVNGPLLPEVSRRTPRVCSGSHLAVDRCHRTDWSWRIAADRSPEQETSSPAQAVNRQGIESSCCAQSAPSLEDPRGTCSL